MKKIIFTFAFLFFIFYYSLLIAQSGWIIQTIGNQYDGFKTLNFFNPNTGMVVSGYSGNPSYLGRIYRTTNAGQNWIYNDFTNPDNFIDGFYFDANNFVLVGQRGSGPGIIAIYTNNVRSDHIIGPISGNITVLTSTDWLNTNTGFVGGWDFNYTMEQRGHFGRVLKTTNHGSNWIDITPINNSDVHAVKFFDLNTGYIIDGDEFKKTTNSGLNWTAISIILSTQSDFHLISKDTFYVCGDIGYVRISSDSGYTWQLRPVGYSVLLRSIKFYNSKTGWTCGNGGNIFRTSNAGINWQKQYSGTNKILLNINIIDSNNLWIGGDSGIVLKTTNGGVTFINNNKEYMSEYKLYQNYPNPFNSATKIKFEIMQEIRRQYSEVKLKIFDITGKVIATLINDYLEPGRYESIFNDENLSSGIYFYSLIINGNKIDSKKMLIIK